MTSVIWMNVKMEGIKENMYIVSSKSEVIGPRGRFKPSHAGNIALAKTTGGYQPLAVYVISCTMFHGEKPEPSYSVDHIDIDYKNNDISNLRWASKSLQRKNSKKKFHKGKRVVYKNTSGKIKNTYKSVSAAGRSLGIQTRNIRRKLEKGPVKVKGGFLEYDLLVPEKNSIIKKVPRWIHPNVKSNWRVSSCGLLGSKKGWTTGSRHGRPAGYYSSNDVFVHRMVVAAFHGRPDNPLRTHVNHKDGNGFNNNIDNLEWATPSENVQHAVDNDLNSCLRPVVKYSLDGTRLGSFKSSAEAIDGNIHHALNNKGSRALGFQWRYADENPPDRIESLLKPVVKYALDGTKLEEFGDVHEAVINSPGDVYYACNNHTTSGGFQWRYKSDAPDKLPYDTSNERSIVKYTSCGTKLEEFDDTTKAAINSPGSDNPSRISTACKNHTVSGGFNTKVCQEDFNGDTSRMHLTNWSPIRVEKSA